MTSRSDPRVTIITPTYNRADFLPETIESILRQDYSNLEYLLIDDGSTDNTAEVVRRFGDRVRYFHHPNMGEAHSVNRGWEMATGRYVCVVSSDDPQRPALIRRSVEVMEQNSAILVTYPDWIMLDEHSNPMETITPPDYDYETMLITCRCFPGPGSFIRREGMLGTIPYLRDPRYPLLSDLECWWRLGLIGPFLHIREILGAWRNHGRAATIQLWRSRTMAEQHLQMVWDFYARPELPPRVRRLEPATKGRMLVVAHSMVLPLSRFASIGYLVRALRYTPRPAWKELRAVLHERVRPWLPTSFSPKALRRRLNPSNAVRFFWKRIAIRTRLRNALSRPFGAARIKLP